VGLIRAIFILHSWNILTPVWFEYLTVAFSLGMFCSFILFIHTWLLMFYKISSRMTLRFYTLPSCFHYHRWLVIFTLWRYIRLYMYISTFRYLPMPFASILEVPLDSFWSSLRWDWGLRFWFKLYHSDGSFYIPVTLLILIHSFILCYHSIL